jgi:hypothetical protein
MKKTAAISLIMMSLIFGANVFFVSAAKAADTPCTSPTEGLMKGVDSGCLCKGDCSPCDLVQVGVNLSDMIVSFAGAAAILMFIIGGIVMITAYGSDRITMGKNIIIAALVGILIIFAAWTLVNTLILAFYGGTSSGTFTTALSSITNNSDPLTYKCGQ